jgi:CheY-like chemotaxis protein
MSTYEKKLILVVEDDPQFRKLLEQSLADNGYEVRSAKNATESLQILEQQRPNVIVLDIGLPGMSGLDLCRSIKANDDLKRIPVVFLTGRESLDEFKACREAGGVFCTSKTNGFDNMLAVVNTLCSVQKNSDPQLSLK